MLSIGRIPGFPLYSQDAHSLCACSGAWILARVLFDKSIRGQMGNTKYASY